MGELDKNVNRKEGSASYEKILVNPIEKDRKEKEMGYQGLGNVTRPQIFAALTSYFQKITSIFNFGNKGQGAIFDQINLLSKIHAFRTLLRQLSKEDQSHNPHFTIQLSLLWHNLLKYFPLRSSSFEDSIPMLSNLKFFISQVQNYPQGADHTLGYYFTHYAGNDWIPFPFMELLQQLHEEFNSNPINNTLGKWLILLNEILDTPIEKK